ncbi:MAG: peptidoglycan-associated lipoprotein Pal [Methylococcales bacterium]|nr:peptidoglycan-associated lipoprotein Pal [Methylococcales bacterium]
MKLNLNNVSTVLVLTSLLLSGCSSTDEKKDEFVDTNAGIENLDNGVNTAGVGDNALSGSELNGENSQGDGQGYGSANGQYGSGRNGSNGGKPVIYFMYDSSQVQEEFVPVIAQHAENLKASASQHVIVEGHGDERGSREYNIALGEQRAKAVARMLTMQGVSDSQVEVVSYGEEKPAASGHDESAWQLNRRAELDFQGQ